MTQWKHVESRFRSFLNNIKITSLQRADGLTKIAGVTKCLNQEYWGANSDFDNSFTIGSWGKGTEVRPPRDIDLYFVLPNDVYYRFEGYSILANRQSALLQEVKAKLLSTFSRSDIKGDGPVVIAAFSTFNIEVVPAFVLDARVQSYWVASTKDGGSYKLTMPLAEEASIDSADSLYGGNLRSLIKMMKTWQRVCSVPIKSFHLELLASDFLGTWAYRHQNLFYYDWMCRDFFRWLTTKPNTYQFRPGTYELVNVGDEWEAKAKLAVRISEAACDLERDNWNALAGADWQVIFGADIPCVAL